jgi:hypothetical protein
VAVGATHVRRVAVIAAACIVAMTISCTSPATKPVTPESSEPRPKPDLTRVTTSMFVDRSAIPNSSAMEFGAPEISSDMQEPEGPVDPPECEPIFAGPRPTQAGSVSWSSTKPAGTSTNSEGRFFHLFLIVPAERPDLRSLLGKCGTVEYQGITTRISALPMPGLPSWAVATRVIVHGADGIAPRADGAGIIGLCRGLYVSVSFTQKPAGDLSPNDGDALVKLFNDQVAKLEAI